MVVGPHRRVVYEALVELANGFLGVLQSLLRDFTRVSPDHPAIGPPHAAQLEQVSEYSAIARQKETGQKDGKRKGSVMIGIDQSQQCLAHGSTVSVQVGPLLFDREYMVH